MGTSARLLPLVLLLGCDGRPPPAVRDPGRIVSDNPDGPVGPRPLPTFVALELDEFPRPAAERCADDRVIDVAPPASIAEALARATPGTTVRVAAGTYIENAGEPTALTWDAHGVCLRGTGDVIVQAAPGQKYGLEPQGDDFVIEGVTLRGFDAALGMWARDGQPQRRATIERVRVEQLTGDSREGVIAYGPVEGLLLLDVTVDGADIGISCNTGPCAHWWVERAHVRGRRGAGNSGADAFAIEDGRQIVVVDTTVENADADGIDTKADDVVVLGARVLGVGRNGVKLWRGGDVLDTVLDGTGADAALVGAAPGRYRYAHVLVTHHGAPGDTQYTGTWAYDEPGPLDLEIVNSIFVDDATGGLWVPGDAKVSLRHVVFADRGAKLLERGDTIYMDAARIEADGLGLGLITEAPRLGAGWAPAAGSPVIDAGEVVPDLDRDLLGHARVFGAAPDLGPVEATP